MWRIGQGSERKWLCHCMWCMRPGFIPDILTCTTLCTLPKCQVSHGTAVPAACQTFPMLLLPQPLWTLSSIPFLQNPRYPQETTPSSQASGEGHHCLTVTLAPGPHLVCSSAPSVTTCSTLGIYQLPPHPYTPQAPLTSTQLAQVQHLEVAATCQQSSLVPSQEASHWEHWSLNTTASTPGILTGSETWLKQDIPNAERFPPMYNIHHRDRADGYWAVLVTAKANLITHEIQHVTTAEEVLIQVQTKKKAEPLIVRSLYRIPSAKSEHQMEKILKTLDSVKTNSIIWIRGDLQSSWHQLERPMRLSSYFLNKSQQPWTSPNQQATNKRWCDLGHLPDQQAQPGHHDHHHTRPWRPQHSAHW